MWNLKTLAFALALALVAVGTVVAVVDTASAWTGCRPHWDGKTWDPVYGPDGKKIAEVPHTETMCY